MSPSPAAGDSAATGGDPQPLKNSPEYRARAAMARQSGISAGARAPVAELEPDDGTAPVEKKSPPPIPPKPSKGVPTPSVQVNVQSPGSGDELDDAPVEEPSGEPTGEPATLPADAPDDAIASHEAALAEMRVTMETLAQQTLDRYGRTSGEVLTGTPQPPTQSAVPAPAPAPVAVPAPAPAQQHTPVFNLRLSADEHRAALETSEGFEKVLVRVAQEAYNQGRIATLQYDLPSVSQGLDDTLSRQVAARMFFVTNPDLKEFANTVALTAHKLRASGKHNDMDSLMDELSKEVRATLRLNGAAVKAADGAIVAPQDSGKKTPRFAGSGSPTVSQGARGAANKSKLQGDSLVEDFAILSSGL